METENVFPSNGGITGVEPVKNKKPTLLEDLPSIRLSPEQIEEIHADEYSLKLFYATRVQALTLGEIKRRFPEPSPKKACAVMNRYVEYGLVHITEEGKYYSNYPRNYINYSDYKYDADLEAKKDAKVFELMKDFTGQPDYWSTKSYFSIDSFFTPEQTQELKAMFTEIKFKAKQFSDQNSKKRKVDGLNFRRLKFYDMILGMLFAVVLCMVPAKQAFAGNDPGSPGIMIMSDVYSFTVEDLVSKMLTSYDIVAAGGGNDPGNMITFSQPNAKLWKSSFDVHGGGSIDPGGKDANQADDRAGGGHDPGVTSEECAEEILDSDGEFLNLTDECLEKAKEVMIDECLSGHDLVYCIAAARVEEVQSSVEL